MISELLSTEMRVEVTDTSSVPDVSDPAITFPNTENKKIKVKRIETSILFVDMRKSSEISASHKPDTLAKLYSSLIWGIAECANNHNGKIRNIVGDGVMVVFDQKNCFKNSIDTAISINSFVSNVLNKLFKKNSIKCGIGIDYGKLLVTKVGKIKKGKESISNKELVWLGNATNLASKITDQANKSEYWSIEGVSEGHYYPYTDKWGWYDYTFMEFIDRLTPNNGHLIQGRNFIHKEEYFKTHFKKSFSMSKQTKPIIITDPIMKGLKKEDPNRSSLVKGLWNPVSLTLDGYSGKLWESDLIWV